MRSGRANGVWVAFLGSVVAIGGMILLLSWPKGATAKGKGLVVYCAAGIKGPVDSVAREYEKAYGVRVQVQYGGSNTILANAEVSRSGDLYLPADDSYIGLARRKALIDEVIPLARMRPVVGVRKGNPKNIKSLEDLLGEGVKVSQANADAAAVGRLVREVLSKSGQWAQLQKRVVVEKTTVSDVANDIKVGAADAGFVWDATVRQMPDLEAVEIPVLSSAAGHVSVAVLRSCTQPAAALHFARYLGAVQKGLVHFKREGFTPAEGDAWAETPELLLYSGAMLQSAIEPTLTAFEQREGVRITRVYNGCGILVAQMKKGEQPDAYFSCDTSFMNQVLDRYAQPLDVSSNRIVILAAKGNPKGFKTLEDLTRPGIKVGVGHEQQSALGALTKIMLVKVGCYDAMRKNVAVESATGDHLINQLRVGTLDAVLAYITNAAKAGDSVTVIPIELEAARAVQPYAVGKTSKYKHASARLLEAITTPESKKRFEGIGYGWLVKE